MKKQTFYGVWKGKSIGVFETWADCQESIKGFSGSQFKKLDSKTLVEAQIEFKKGYLIKEKSTKENKRIETTNKLQDHKNKMGEGVVYYCDGACPKNPGRSGSGVSVYFKKKVKKLFYGQYVEDGSNNISEIEGFIFCLEHIKKNNINGHRIQIFLDSQYTINAITSWSYGWEKNNWLTKDKKPVKNIDLVKKAFVLYKELKNKIEIEKVKSHIGVEGNELADRMAILSVKNKQVEWVEYEEKDIDLILSIKY